jgi:hypothetical protein
MPPLPYVVVRFAVTWGRIVVESGAPAFYDDATGPRLTRRR